MAWILDILSWILLMGGAFLGLSGAIGTLRFPDFYTRVHACSVTDTMCALMIISGLILQAGFTLITVKLIFILLFLWYTSPASSHALVRAAHHMGLPAKLSMPDEATTPVQPAITASEADKNRSDDEAGRPDNTGEDSTSKP